MAGDSVQPKKPDLGVEFGVGLAMPFSSPYYSPQNGQGSGALELQYFPAEDEPTVEQMVRMRRQDGQARALYRLVTLPIRSALRTSSFVPAAGKRGGRKEAEFAEQMFRLPASGGGMETAFDKVIAQLLQAACRHTQAGLPSAGGFAVDHVSGMDQALRQLARLAALEHVVGRAVRLVQWLGARGDVLHAKHHPRNFLNGGDAHGSDGADLVSGLERFHACASCEMGN